MKNILTILGATMLVCSMSCKKADPLKPVPEPPITVVPSPTITSFSPAKGSFNNIVSIKGTHFDTSAAKTSVTLNGTKVDLVSVSDTQIQVRLTQSMTTGKIVVTVPGGTATSASDFVVLPGSWTRKADFPLGWRHQAMAFSINGKGYVFGGTTNDDSLDEFYEYDPVTDKWTKKTGPGFYLNGGVGLSIGNKGYVGIGYNAIKKEYVNEWWEYDPANDHWTRKQDFPGPVRLGSFGLSMNGKAYAGLGYQRSAGPPLLFDWYEYDPVADSWTRKSDVPEKAGLSMSFASGFGLGDVLYLGLGAYQQKNWWTYAPSTDQWTSMPDHPYNLPAFAANGFTLNGKGYIAGGGAECWAFDPATKQWSQMAFFDGAAAGIAFTIGNKAYYGLGDNTTGQLWEFNPGQ